MISRQKETKQSGEEPATHLLREDVIALAQVPKEFPAKVRPSKMTVWRWAKHGKKEVKLATLAIGNRLVTSRQEVTRFLNATQGK